MCALIDNGNLFAWGLGDYGALGTGEFRSCSTPTKVKLPTTFVVIYLQSADRVPYSINHIVQFS